MKGKQMEVLLLKDVPSLGLAGQVKKVSEGYARNFLFPKKLASVASSHDVERVKRHVEQYSIEQQIAGSRVAILAEQMKNLIIVLKKKSNDKGKLYGAVGPEDVVELLSKKNINIEKKQVEFTKAVRSTGDYDVIVRLTSKLKPTVKLRVEAEKE